MILPSVCTAIVVTALSGFASNSESGVPFGFSRAKRVRVVVTPFSGLNEVNEPPTRILLPSP